MAFVPGLADLALIAEFAEKRRPCRQHHGSARTRPLRAPRKSEALPEWLRQQRSLYRND